MDNGAIGGGVCNKAGVAGCVELSFTATTMPEFDESVLRGLLNVEEVPALAPVAGGSGETARETPGRRPPSTAALGRFVRCQSW